MKRAAIPFVEELENRTFLSTTLPVPPTPPPLPAPPLVVSTVSTVSPTPVQSAITLHLTAGVPFTGEVAFYPSPVLDPPDAYAASINWGDGATTPAKLQYTINGKVGGYEAIGSHAYAAAGTYKILTTYIVGPINTGGGPAPATATTPTKIVAIIDSTAIVAPRVGNSPGGVTIDEQATDKFTAKVGTFTTLAPADNLSATIDWGDGSTSPGTLLPNGVVGLDEVSLVVAGTHTYSLPGIYPIHIVVTKPGVGATPTADAVHVVTTIDSTAIVTPDVGHPISLPGQISGTYTVASPVVDPSATTTAGILDEKIYHFTGNGTAGDLGSVSATATVVLPGLPVASTPAAPVAHPLVGTMTLTNAMGSVTLALTAAPVATPVTSTASAVTTPGAFPSVLDYAIIAGTGAFAGDTASGTISVVLNPPTTVTAATATPEFVFVIK